jgi:predicted TIM-barrel fold metal-dependent hydrolase
MPEVAPAAVDAHQHVWDPARADYPWMTPALDRLRRPFDHADVVAEQAEVGVGATVLVQAADNLDDTANMLRVARAHSQVAGVVAWVPLDDPAAARLLDSWQRAAEPVVGVRHLLHREADPDWLLRPEVQDGLAVLAERGLTFDVCAETAPLLRHVPTLAERYPGAQPGGGPPRQAPDSGSRLAALGRPADRGRRGPQRDRQGLRPQHRRRPRAMVLGRLPALR